MKIFIRERCWLTGVTCAFLCMTATHLLAFEQLIPEHPRADLEINEVSTDDDPVNFMLSSVQRIRHQLTFERVIKVFGPVSSNTYRMPQDLNRQDVTNWFKRQIETLGGSIEFECEQRDCGRATLWATDIFQRRVLTASDLNQHYLAVSVDKQDVQHLVMIYVVERANHRVYAHVVEIVPNERVTIDVPVDVSDELLRFGTVRVPNVVPDAQGGLSEEALKTLEELAGSELQEFSDSEMYVICHVNGADSVEELIDYSKSCAEIIVAIFTDKGLSAIPFGIGPLSPLERSAVPRVELVISDLLRQSVD